MHILGNFCVFEKVTHLHNDRKGNRMETAGGATDLYCRPKRGAMKQDHLKRVHQL